MTTMRESEDLPNPNPQSINETGDPTEVRMHIVDGASSNPVVIGRAVLTLTFVALALSPSSRHDLLAAKPIFFAHRPIMAIEAMLCVAAATLIRQARPELFGVFNQPVARNGDA